MTGHCFVFFFNHFLLGKRLTNQTKNKKQKKQIKYKNNTALTFHTNEEPD